MKNEEKMKVNKLKEKEKNSNKSVNKNETKNNLEKERKHCLSLMESKTFSHFHPNCKKNGSDFFPENDSDSLPDSHGINPAVC